MSDETEKAVEDLTRAVRKFRDMHPKIPTKVRDFSEMSISDDRVTDGERELAFFTVGLRGDLTRKKARESARGYLDMMARRPKITVVCAIPGYDDDTRELWEIPEVRKFVRWWVEVVGIRKIAEMQPYNRNWIMRCLV